MQSEEFTVRLPAKLKAEAAVAAAADHRSLAGLIRALVADGLARRAAQQQHIPDGSFAGFSGR